MLTPEQRSQRARVAALARWSRQDTRTAMTAARRGFLRRFETAVPASVTDPIERQRCAERALKAHMIAMAMRSAKSRRARKATKAREATRA